MAFTNLIISLNIVNITDFIQQMKVIYSEHMLDTINIIFIIQNYKEYSIFWIIAKKINPLHFNLKFENK